MHIKYQNKNVKHQN